MKRSAPARVGPQRLKSFIRSLRSYTLSARGFKKGSGPPAARQVKPPPPHIHPLIEIAGIVLVALTLGAVILKLVCGFVAAHGMPVGPLGTRVEDARVTSVASPSPSTEVRRATPVSKATKEVRKAELVSLPVGGRWHVHMPDGGSPIARYMGTVDSFNQLPLNPALGDMWGVVESGASWVWYQPANFTHPSWVDP